MLYILDTYLHLYLYMFYIYGPSKPRAKVMILGRETWLKWLSKKMYRQFLQWTRIEQMATDIPWAEWKERNLVRHCRLPSISQSSPLFILAFGIALAWPGSDACGDKYKMIRLPQASQHGNDGVPRAGRQGSPKPQTSLCLGGQGWRKQGTRLLVGREPSPRLWDPHASVWP